MAIEFELKYRSTPEQQAAILAAAGGAEQRYHMQTTYYDTPTGDLSQQHITLRRRMENDCSVCTLKTPSEAGGRGEFELECPDIETAIPELCKLSGRKDLLPLLSAGVIAVCGAQFTRISRTITTPDCTLELAVDQGILTGGGKEIPLCEVEVELKEGSRESACMYAAVLAAIHGLWPEERSKFRRALALYKGE